MFVGLLLALNVFLNWVDVGNLRFGGTGKARLGESGFGFFLFRFVSATEKKSIPEIIWAGRLLGAYREGPDELRGRSPDRLGTIACKIFFSSPDGCVVVIEIIVCTARSFLSSSSSWFPSI